SMQRSILRSFVATAMLTSVALFAFAGPAAAKGKPVTITLACTPVASSISATVQITTGGFPGSDLGSPVSLSCGPDSISGLASETTTVKGLPQAPGGFR